MCRCDSDDVLVSIQWSKEESKYVGYLMNLSYTAMDYASYNRAEVLITLQNGQQHTTSVLDTPDYDSRALVLRTFSTKLSPLNKGVCDYKGSVHFDINHHHYRHQHQAIENATECTLAKLFPSNLRSSQPGMTVQNTGLFPLDWQYQLKALRQMFTCNSEAPYLLLGPFGTGKTYLLVAAVVKLLEAGGNQVLVCTHSNRGADGIYSNLQNAVSRTQRYTVARMVGGAEAAENFFQRHPSASVVTPDRVDTSYSALVTTFGVAGNLVELVRRGYLCFSHILIDEGAQCPEPEALGALVLAERNTRVIIVGDSKQVGEYTCVYGLFWYGILTLFMMCTGRTKSPCTE